MGHVRHPLFKNRIGANSCMQIGWKAECFKMDTTNYAMCETCMLAANRIGLVFITLRDASQCSSKYNFKHMLESVPDMVPA